MEIKTYFFDTYALFEIISGNPGYRKYSYNVAIITTRLNLMGLYYGLLVKHGKDIADRYYDALVQFSIDVTDDIIKQAMLFRHINKERGLSYVDCIGYITARSRNVNFLTGDKEFEGMDNVEYVK